MCRRVQDLVSEHNPEILGNFQWGQWMVNDVGVLERKSKSPVYLLLLVRAHFCTSHFSEEFQRWGWGGVKKNALGFLEPKEKKAQTHFLVTRP